MLVNAEGLVAGRMASKIAKRAINGETIIIVNAEKVILVGTRQAVMKKFQQRVDAAVKSNPLYEPKYDRVPSKILQKMIRGMLPNKSRTRERLLKQIKIFNSVPEKIKLEEAEKMDEIKCNEKHDFMTMEEVAKLLGGKW